MEKKIVLIFIVFTLLCITPQTFAKQIDSKYFKGTITDKNGNQVDKIIVPGRPPRDFRMPVAEPTDATVTISNVPAFDWSYGCSATSGAMMAGHYDNTGYANMYAGSANGGVCPMTNSTWGNGECPLSATHQGYDGLCVRGHVDDYWVSYLSGQQDPYITGSWTPHANSDCTGDYMGTNQSALGNDDGSTTFYYNTNGTALYDYTGCEPGEKDGCHGLRQFFESRGYTVTSNYSQYIIEQGFTYGFTFAQYMAEIDAGRPVLIQVEGHTMLGYGYDDTSNLVYLHDTWDHNSHTMTWGGSYSGMNHYAVGVFVLASASGPPGAPTNPSPSDGESDVNINTLINWTNGALTDDVEVYFSDNQILVTNKDASVMIYSGTAITGIDPNGVFSLTNDTTYYWRIVCQNSSRAETDGPVWSFTTEGVPVIETVLNYYPDITYYMTVPDGNGISKFGVYYTPADECDLTKIKAYFYGTAGSPTSCDLRIYDALDDGTGVEYPNNLLHTENVPIASIVAGWSEPEFTLATPIHFNAGENFFIIYEVVGVNPSDVVHLLRSEGVTGGVEGTHSICEYSGSWYYHDVIWVSPFEVAMDATVEYAGVIPPNFTVTPSTVDFMRTAIGGWKNETITLQNAGGGQVVVNSVSLAGDSQILIYDNNTYPATLLNNESISFLVAYGPDAVVTNNATLSISETSSSRTDHNIPITGEGYNHNSWASGTPIFDQPPTGNQGDNSWSMSTSDATPGYLHAENFWGLSEPIEAIEFWGINWYHDGTQWIQSDVEDPMTFDIAFYTDHATEYSPDVLVNTFSLTLYRTDADTTFSGGSVYRYFADLPSEVDLEDGWVSIQGTSVSSPVDPWFLWSTSPVGDLGNVSYSDPVWDFEDKDLAFALYGEMQPPLDLTISIVGTDAILSWTSETGMDYIIYSDTYPNGSFDTVEGTVTDGSGNFTDPTGGADKKFYRIASSLTRSNELKKIEPVFKKANIIRSINDSKLTNGIELKR